MLKRSLRALGLLFVLACAPRLVGAQGYGPPLGVVMTYSTGSSSPMTDPIRLSTVDLEVVVPMSQQPTIVGVEYAPALSLAFVENNPTGVVERLGSAWVVWNPPPAVPTFGIGLVPANFRVWIGGERIRLQADASGGFIWFAQPLLAANATRFNFTGSVGLALRLEIPGGRRAVLGYRIHHASNGGTGDVNPGIDSRQIYVGFWLL